MKLFNVVHTFSIYEDEYFRIDVNSIDILNFYNVVARARYCYVNSSKNRLYYKKYTLKIRKYDKKVDKSFIETLYFLNELDKFERNYNKLVELTFEISNNNLIITKTFDTLNRDELEFLLELDDNIDELRSVIRNIQQYNDKYEDLIVARNNKLIAFISINKLNRRIYNMSLLSSDAYYATYDMFNVFLNNVDLDNVNINDVIKLLSNSIDIYKDFDRNNKFLTYNDELLLNNNSLLAIVKRLYTHKYFFNAMIYRNFNNNIENDIAIARFDREVIDYINDKRLKKLLDNARTNLVIKYIDFFDDRYEKIKITKDYIRRAIYKLDYI